MKTAARNCFRIKRIFQQDSGGNYSDTSERLATNTVGNPLITDDNKKEILVSAYKPNLNKTPDNERYELNNKKLDWFKEMRMKMPEFQKRKYRYITIMIIKG